ncbi:MAG: NADP-dependent isocitrate dehydrogenase [Sphingomonadales bacterium]|nr:NADP-dependent isocitrate dehydrogenase [Sphingomonadales bacterium]
MNYSSNPVPITLAHGDGIGPEIMCATLRMLEASGAPLDIETIEIGEKMYLSGNTSGIGSEAWDSLFRTRVFLKGPITTPFGGGYKSLNVTARITLGLFANIRPCISYSPFVFTRFPKMDVVIIRENEEDLYAGIEYRQTRQVYQTLKLVSEPGSEKIVRYAFEYARNNGRRKVTCLIKDNIMKVTDGLFHRVFDRVASEFPDIESDSMIIDIGTARLADSPDMFDVIVTQNLYGDIISDVAAQLSGSVGIGGSSNVGDKCAMFEAIHGSAPDLAGKDLANPSGLLLSAIMMLVHINLPGPAAALHNAWLKTLEDGIHTGDVFKTGMSRKRVGTQGFADAVIARLGQMPAQREAVTYAKQIKPIQPSDWNLRMASDTKTLAGVDIFLDYPNVKPNDLGVQLESLTVEGLKLVVVSNRGVKVYPNAFADTFCSDHWRCRFESTDKGSTIQYRKVLAQMESLSNAGLDCIKSENLYLFDGKAGYSLAQGQ